MITFTKIKI